HLDRHARLRGPRTTEELSERLPPRGLGCGERPAVLRAPGARERRLELREGEREHVAESGLRRLRRAKEPLGAGVRLDERHVRLVASREAEIRERRLVDGEEADRGAV